MFSSVGDCANKVLDLLFFRFFIKHLQRELVQQVYSVFESLGGESGLNILGFSGDISLTSETNKAIDTFYLLETDSYYSVSKMDILISTPGRFVEHLNHNSGFDLSTIEFLVLDETGK